MADMLNRLDQFKSRLRSENLDGFALMPGPLLSYLTGAHLHVMERAILTWIPAEKDSSIHLVAPNFETAMVDTTSFAWKMYPWSDSQGAKSAFDLLAENIRSSSPSETIRVGLDPLNVRYQEWWALEKSLSPISVHWIDASVWLSEVRAVKDAQELSLLRIAAKMATDSLNRLLPQIKVGQAEHEISNILKIELLKVGSESLPFEPLIQSGPNSAIPHASPGSRRLEKGDFLLIDFGARHKGYVSDITRTFHIGPASERAREIHETVRLANLKALEITKPGVTCGEIDDAARSVIESAGMGEYFTHRTGHGMGLECHEPPYMVAGSNHPLQSGHVFTIEPGIYIPEFGGVRIEDDVIVTDQDGEAITDFPRELIEL